MSTNNWIVRRKTAIIIIKLWWSHLHIRQMTHSNYSNLDRFICCVITIVFMSFMFCNTMNSWLRYLWFFFSLILDYCGGDNLFNTAYKLWVTGNVFTSTWLCTGPLSINIRCILLFLLRVSRKLRNIEYV